MLRLNTKAVENARQAVERDKISAKAREDARRALAAHQPVVRHSRPRS